MSNHGINSTFIQCGVGKEQKLEWGAQLYC